MNWDKEKIEQTIIDYLMECGANYDTQTGTLNFIYIRPSFQRPISPAILRSKIEEVAGVD